MDGDFRFSICTVQVKGHFVKNHLCVFVNGLVENPAFNSQSKESLTSKDTAFGSVPKISDAGLKTIEKSEIVDRYSSMSYSTINSNIMPTHEVHHYNIAEDDILLQ